MTYREAIAGLLAVLDGDRGAYRTPAAQAAIADARSLAAPTDEVSMMATLVRCNTPGCPSRLDLTGDWSATDAMAMARTLMWSASMTVHFCPSCTRENR